MPLEPVVELDTVIPVDAALVVRVVPDTPTLLPPPDTPTVATD